MALPALTQCLLVHTSFGDMMSLALLSQVMLLCVALVCVAVSLHKDACCLHGACRALQLQGANLGRISQ